MSDGVSDDGGLEFAHHDAPVTVVSSGDPIRSALAVPNALVKEAVFTFGPDGITTSFIDAASVGTGNLTIPADALSVYDYDGPDGGIDVGVSIEGDAATLPGALRTARKGADDPLRIDVVPVDDPDGNTSHRLHTQVLRADVPMRRETDTWCVSPDGIRGADDVPDVIKPSARARIDRTAWCDVIEEIHREADFLRVANDGGDLRVSTGEDSMWADDFVFPGVVEPVADSHDPAGDPETATAKYITDYLADYADALRSAKPDTITFRWGDGYPLDVEFRHTDHGFRGYYALAPRVESR